MSLLSLKLKERVLQQTLKTIRPGAPKNPEVIKSGAPDKQLQEKPCL